MRISMVTVAALAAVSLFAAGSAEAKSKKTTKKNPARVAGFVERGGGSLVGSVGTQPYGYIDATARRDAASRFFTRRMLDGF
jgi:archaellin